MKIDDFNDCLEKKINFFFSKPEFDIDKFIEENLNIKDFFLEEIPEKKIERKHHQKISERNRRQNLTHLLFKFDRIINEKNIKTTKASILEKGLKIILSLKNKEEELIKKKRTFKHTFRSK